MSTESFKRRETNNGLSFLRNLNLFLFLFLSLFIFIPMTLSLQNEDSEFALKQIGNEGLTKQILSKGLTWQTPFSGDQVEG